MQNSCSSNQKSCSCPCHDQSCSCSCHIGHSKEPCGEHEECGGYDYFFQVADAAWSEVLKEKIKEHIIATQNDRMTELAKMVAEANGKRWKNKMEKKRGGEEFKEELCHFFSKK